MKKDPLIFLAHMIESIELIEAYIEGQSETSFKKSIQLQDSCIRRLEIIGEAVKNLPSRTDEFSGCKVALLWLCTR